MNHIVKSYLFVCLLIMSAVSVAGCTKMYTLPDAPPKSDWVSVEKPQESKEELVRRFLDAKRAAIQCYAALASNNWEGALEWMSEETVDYFSKHSGGYGAIAAFDMKQLDIDGRTIEFDPVGDVFIRGLNDIRDEFGGRTDDENERRKVLYAVSSSGEARELVFIYEKEKWRLDSPHIQTELLTE